ncbi:hypothetical protein CSKR_110586 [Clonorchis sinensis]|uniref:Homeobox domain-containing protein n=1 Tax=Clonorchis sinensis TaxID=79923 RepID=A0A8T1MUF0_CLOSI|nr:hypothetical protein CSKR_110586 [Clonorchis sinensis]
MSPTKGGVKDFSVSTLLNGAPMRTVNSESQPTDCSKLYSIDSADLDSVHHDLCLKAFALLSSGYHESYSPNVQCLKEDTHKTAQPLTGNEELDPTCDNYLRFSSGRLFNSQEVLLPSNYVRAPSLAYAQQNSEHGAAYQSDQSNLYLYQWRKTAKYPALYYPISESTFACPQCIDLYLHSNKLEPNALVPRAFEQSIHPDSETAGAPPSPVLKSTPAENPFAFLSEDSEWELPTTDSKRHINSSHSEVTAKRATQRRSILRRTVFSESQRHNLEMAFRQHAYITKPDRRILAERLGLKENQVKIWFQNRRMKWRTFRQHSSNPHSGDLKATGNVIPSLDTSTMTFSPEHACVFSEFKLAFEEDQLSLVYGITYTVEFQLVVENVDRWSELRSAWGPGYYSQLPRSIDSIWDQYSSYYSSVRMNSEMSEDNLKMKLVFAIRKFDPDRCNMECLNWHIQTFVNYLTSPERSPKVTIEGVKLGQPLFGAGSYAHSRLPPYYHLEDIVRNYPMAKTVEEEPKPVQTVLFHSTTDISGNYYNELKVLAPTQEYIQMTLQAIALYRHGNDQLFSQLGTLLYAGVIRTIGIDIQFSIDSDKPEKVVEVTRNRIKQTFATVPSTNHAMRIRTSPRMCTMGKSNAHKFLVPLFGKLKNNIPHEEWRQLQDESSAVYKKYRDQVVDSLSKTLVKNKVAPEYFMVDFNSFWLGPSGEAGASCRIYIDGVKSGSAELLKTMIGFSWFTESDANYKLVGQHESRDDLFVFDIPFSTLYGGDEHCWYDENAKKSTSIAPNATLPGTSNAPNATLPDSASSIQPWLAKIALLLLVATMRLISP